MPKLGFNARAFAHMSLGAGEAVLSPLTVRSPWEFARTPAGLTVIALVLLLIGGFVEEGAGLRRIKTGICIRLMGAALCAISVAWCAQDSNGSVFGWALAVAGAGALAWAARADAMAVRDTRSVQDRRLASIDDQALSLVVMGEAVRVPISAIGEVSVTEYDSGRGVLVHVRRPSAVQGAKLPAALSLVDADVIFLTEHQCNADASEVAERIRASQRSEGYR